MTTQHTLTAVLVGMLLACDSAPLADMADAASAHWGDASHNPSVATFRDMGSHDGPAAPECAAPAGAAQHIPPLDYELEDPTAAGWVWEGSYPQNAHLNAISGSSRDHAWAVGDGGVAVHWNGDRWTPYRTGVRQRLNDVWVESEERAYAVGDQGTVLVSSGTDWVGLESGLADDLRQIWGTDGGTIYALGSGLYRRDGLVWVAIGDAPTGITAAAETPGEDLWVATRTEDEGVPRLGLWHRGRDGWSERPVPVPLSSASLPADRITHVFVTDSEVMISGPYVQPVYQHPQFFVGELGDGEWSFDVFDGERPSMWAESCSSWVVDGSPLSGRFHTRGSGPDWRESTIDFNLNGLNALWGPDANHVWAVGEGGSIARWDGERWTRESSETTSHDFSAVASADGRVWAGGGYHPHLHQRDDSGWRQIEFDTWFPVSDLAARGRDVWAVGYQSVVHWDGSGLTDYPGEPQPWGSVQSVWLGEGESVWVAGGSHDGVMRLLLGQLDETWQIHLPGPYGALRAISGVSQDDLWAVGLNGAVYHRADGAWQAASRAHSEHLLDVWAAASDDVWAVGLGTVVHWDGSRWSEVEVPVEADWQAVAGCHADDVTAVGPNGAMLHWDGHRWEAVPRVTTHALNDVDCDGGGTLRVVGDFGTIVRRVTQN